MISIRKNINHWLATKAEPILMEVAREMARTSGYGSGNIINHSDYLDEIMTIYNMERDRMSMYQDAWTMQSESPLVDQANNALAQDATGQPFKIITESSRHEKIANELFERINYWYERTMLLSRGILTGDLFLKLDIDTTYAPRSIGQIEQVRILPEFTMHRNTDFSGSFTNQFQAFTQRNKPRNFMTDVPFSMEKSLNFNGFEVVHARYNHLKQINPKYGLSAYNSARITYGAVASMLKDMVIARHNGTFNRLQFDFDPSVDQKFIDEYEAKLKNTKITPAMYHISKGMTVTPIDQKNNLLQNIEDVKMQIDILKVGMLYPFEMFGFGNASGEQLEKMETRLKRTISFLHRFEEYQIVRPMLDREFMLKGFRGVKYKIENPEISFEDSNKKAKKQISKVQAGILSRRTAAMDLEDMTLEEAEAELTQSRKELEQIGQITKYQAPGESLEKGKKGVETKETENQNISDTEGISDEDK